MILVDSSVWIDYFNGQITPETDKLDQLLGQEPLAIGDLNLTEVLQGFDGDRDFNTAKRLLLTLDIKALGGEHIGVEAAKNYRALRRKGITVRKTVDSIIGTWCIENGFDLLHNDRDFDGFEKHRGLRVVRT